MSFFTKGDGFDFVNILAFISIALVLIGTYLPWIPFLWPRSNAIYFGFYSAGKIESGYQLFDIPIVIFLIVGLWAHMRLENKTLSTLLVFSSAFLSFSSTIFHSYITENGIYALKYGYYITILGIITFVISFIGKIFSGRHYA